MRTDILERKEEILKWISEKQSKAFICQQLKCKADTLQSYLKKMGIQYDGNRGGKGHKMSNSRKTAIKYAQSTCVHSHILKLKLIEDGIKEHRCERCGCSEWQGQPIPLELHHKNGNHYDNSLDNLEILCPNCHALESNNRGAANKGK